MLFKFQNPILLLTAVRGSECQRKLGFSCSSVTPSVSPTFTEKSASQGEGGWLGGGQMPHGCDHADGWLEPSESEPVSPPRNTGAAEFRTPLFPFHFVVSVKGGRLQSPVSG